MTETVPEILSPPDDPLFFLLIAKDFSITISASNIGLGLAALTLIGVLIYKTFAFFKTHTMELDEAEIGIGSQKFKLRPNLLDSQIAYKIWIELSTRKIGIPVDLEKDVVEEIYNSWYEFFRVTRELLKEVPVSKIKRTDTQKIIEFSIDVLNQGIRPHLTEWQARFRKWYARELLSDSNIQLSPQQIQSNFPKYEELSADLIKVNKSLTNYRKALHKIVYE